MAKGILYGVSVGCGNPDDMTIRAVKTIKACKNIIYPESKAENSVALKIVSSVVDLSGKNLIPFESMMTKDKILLDKQYGELAEKTSFVLDRGEDIAFITIGDVSLYSTFWYLGEKISDRGYEIKTVAGVPSFCSGASAVNMPISLGEEPVHIIPSSYNIDDILNLKGTIILMKSGRKIDEVADFLRVNNMTDSTVLIQNCGLENERIYKNIPENIDKSYFSLFIVRRS